MLASVGSTATAPMASVGSWSKTADQCAPSSVVFQTPPSDVPRYAVWSLEGATATDVPRPLHGGGAAPPGACGPVPPSSGEGPSDVHAREGPLLVACSRCASR